MRVALVHDYLNQWGGAEEVLSVFLEMFPDADIYTLLYDKKRTYGRFANNIKKTSWLDLPLVRQKHRFFIPLMPLAAKFLCIPDKYDLIISSTAGFAKGISCPPNTPHLSYCHTPLRYAWESDYLNHMRYGLKLKLLGKPILAYLKWWDYRAGQKPDVLLANSSFIAAKIKKYYGREAQVIHPPVDLSVFYPEANQRKTYFLAVGRFMHYKRFDLIIQTFQKLKLPLVLVGHGPEEAALKKMATKDAHIKFLPFAQNKDELRLIYTNARALIFPQVEDFGLVAAESIACGTPVIAFNAGGAKEIVTDKSGVLFEEQTSTSLMNAVQQFISKEASFRPELLSAEARKFSKDLFKQNIITAVDKLLKASSDFKTAAIPSSYPAVLPPSRLWQ